jgi:methionyl-tRNA formyltransferase
MKNIFFLVNSLAEFNFFDLIKKYIDDVKITVGETLPHHTDAYDLIVLWSYQKIIPNIHLKKNIILFHSTNLPEGKGWAPIYYTISGGKEFYVISGIFAGEGVDNGDIIVRARFRMKDNYTADIIRQWDHEISILLIGEILKKFQNRTIEGTKQTGAESYYPRRRSEDNRVDPSSRLLDIIGHLRGCEKNHPAFFYYNETKYYVHIYPDTKPEFPEDLEVIF